MRTTIPKRAEVIGEEAPAAVRAVVPSKMMAAVLYGSEDLRLEKIDVPPLAADEVLLRVRLALTDGTDLKVWQRGYHAKMIQPPAVFGHEVVGEVAAVGKRVDRRWRLGLRVIAASSAPCLRCFHCRRAQENLCEDLLFNNGAYAEYMRIPGRIVMENMLEVPHSVDDGSAALVEPLACVLRGIHEMEVRTGDTAVVIGCGPIGLKYVRMLSRRGVRVIALARRVAPLEVARRMGAIATINVTQVRDVVAAVRNLTEDERGADSVVEAAGNPATWKQALAMVRRSTAAPHFSKAYRYSSALQTGRRGPVLSLSKTKMLRPNELEIAANAPLPGCTPEAAQNYTRWLATHHYENFSVVSWLLPKELHQHFYNVYAN